MVFNHACRLVRDTLLGYSRSVVNYDIDQQVHVTVSQLGLHRRGCRGDRRCRRRHILAAHTVTSAVSRVVYAGEIPTINGNRCSDANNNQLFHGRRDARVS
jgi:hypothetical protein